jgi:alpha-tubulin suppressor-like RCC1 family protein
MGDNLPAVELGSGHSARSLVVGDSHVCALLDDLQVTCWGANWAAQLGLEDNIPRGDGLRPLGPVTEVVRLGTGVRPVSLASGGNHTCALLPGGLVKCWGANGSGQLGIGDPGGSWGDVPGEMGDHLPVLNLGTGHHATALAVGGSHTCALLDDGTVKCWGLNDAGQLGQNSTTNLGGRPEQMGDALPVVSLGTGRTALAIAAGNQHTCAVLDDHKLKCWGLNDDGQLGLDARNDNRGDGLAADGMTPAAEMGDNLPYVDIGP